MKLASRTRYYLERWSQLNDEMEPLDEKKLPTWKRKRFKVQSMVIFALFDLNDFLIGKYAPNQPIVYDTSQFPWVKALEEATPQIRKELEAYLAAGPLRRVGEVNGLDPDSDDGLKSAPVGTGTWRAVLFYACGKWIPQTAKHFPTAVRLLDDVNPKAHVGFSALEPHSHIAPHTGANRGALRFQLPIIVPGEYGDCRIRVKDNMVKWREGEAVIFDLIHDHEAWNDSDELRVLLMVEIIQPLKGWISVVNRMVQYSFRWHSSYRGVPEKVTEFGREHDMVGAGIN